METTLETGFKNLFEKNQINIWTIGNTGARNPLRLPGVFSIYTQSQSYGHLANSKENQARFTHDLSLHGLANYSDKISTAAIIARKFRYVFEKFGFIYPEKNKKLGNKLPGPADTITPLGKTFLAAETLDAQQECYLRGLITPIETLSDSNFFSPLLWTIKVLLALEKRTGSCDLSYIEFVTCVQTTSPNYDIDKIIDMILSIRDLRKNAVNKKKFDKTTKETVAKNYDKKIHNFDDYGDLNIRYLVCTGILKRAGRGITIVSEYKDIAKELVKGVTSSDSYMDLVVQHCNGAKLPQDNLQTAIKLMKNYQNALKSNNVKYSIPPLSLDTVKNVNIIISSLKSALSKFNEDQYALRQKEEWFEIYNYMLCLIKNNGHKRSIGADKYVQVPTSEAASYLEWTTWRSFLAIDHILNQPYEARGFKIDQDYLPVGTAPGNGPDLFFEFKNFALVIEVTMSTNSRQEAMEGEPVRRHVADYVEKYSDKPVIGIFIANKIDSNTAETFRVGIWYTKNDKRLTLKIVPFTLPQFAEYFKYMFENDKATPEQVVQLFKECLRAKDGKYAPEWKKAINDIVQEEINS